MAMAHAQNMQPSIVAHDSQFIGASIESSELSNVLQVKQRTELLPEVAPGQMTIRQELVGQDWLLSERPALGQIPAV